MFRELCGDTTLRNVVLVTNMWTRDPHDVNEAREIELFSSFFRPVLGKGARMVRHHDTAQSAHDIIQTILANHPMALQIQRELVDERKGIVETAAGRAVNRELVEQAERHRVELEKVEKGMRRALEEKNEEMRQELEEQAKTLQEQVKKIEKESREMAANYAAEKGRMEAKMREMEREAKEERERAETEYRQQLADLDRRLRDTNSASAADRAKLEKEVRRLQEQIEQIKDSKGTFLNYAIEKEKVGPKMNEVSWRAMGGSKPGLSIIPQLTELDYRPQDMANASVAGRVELGEVEGLQNNDTPNRQTPLSSTRCVRVLLCLVTHDC